jgi:hypothetical protein
VPHRVVAEILESNSWRDGEFAKIKANPFRVDETLWCRLSIPLIYAHWEGFVVSSLKETLKYLNDLRLKCSQVPTHLVVLGMGDSYKPLSGKQSFAQRVEFTEKFNELLSSTIKFTTRIETKSNLNGEVLRDLCAIFKFNVDRFSDVIPDVNRLVHVRNSIAHGENSVSPDMENVKKYIIAVRAGMDGLLDEIELFLSGTRYLISCL